MTEVMVNVENDRSTIAGLHGYSHEQKGTVEMATIFPFCKTVLQMYVATVRMVVILYCEKHERLYI